LLPSPRDITLGQHERCHFPDFPPPHHHGQAITAGGSRTIIAESLLLKQQLIIHSRSRQRAPNLSVQDRAQLGFWALFLNHRRIARSAIIIKPSTLLKFHFALKKRKYRQLYSPRGGRKPGPKGPPREVIDAIVEMKRRNHRFGCPRIAQQINLAFGLELDKDVVRRILATHYKPSPDSNGPSWISTPAASLASLSMQIMLMAQHSVGCSTMPRPGRVGRNISAQITILCFNIIGGKPICVYLKSKKSNLFRMCQCPIHLLRDSSVAFGESYWTTPFSGRRQTWKTNSAIISAITTSTEHILDGTVRLQSNQQTKKLSTSMNVDGGSTVVDCLNCLLLPELPFRQGHVKPYCT
jgi:hypothetical protein